MLSYRRILGRAWPIVLANCAVPLLGLVDTAGALGGAIVLLQVPIARAATAVLLAGSIAVFGSAAISALTDLVATRDAAL